jgi:hypothetical protein
MSVAKQALGFVEEKLRRVFNLAGPIGLTLNPDVTPVIMVDDLRDPGHAFYQGRSFAVTHSDVPAAGTRAAVTQFNADCVIEGFWAFGTIAAAGNLDLWTVTPAEMVTTPPTGAVTTLSGSWRDRKMVTLDQPPIANSPWAVITGTARTTNNGVWSIGAVGAAMTLPGYVPIRMFVPAGGALAWTATNTGAQALSLGCIGRVWPQ